MKKNSRRILFTLLFLSLCICTGSSVFAQTGNIPGSFKFSFQERVRIETWDNAVTLSRAAKAGSSYLRNRTSIMGQWFPSETLELSAKLTNEFRTYFSPSTNNFHFSELFIDQLYIKWNTKSILDGVLTLGRQNINLGEGFIVMDGSPLDGSRSTYFNAFKYDLNLAKGQTLSIIALYNPKIDDLPVINGRDIDPAFQGDGSWTLTEQNETGLGVYYAGQLAWGNIQSYFLRKNYIDPEQKLSQIESDVNTIGTRMSIPLNTLFNFTFEGAYQFGSFGDNSRSSYGGYAYLDLKPGWGVSFLPKTFTVGTIILSGDDPATKDNEGWDPVFSRWPKWSESYIYTLVKESGGKPAYWTNMISIYASMKFIFDEQISFNFDYHHLTAPQTPLATAFLSGTGTTRGDLFIAKLLLDINKNLSGHFILEHFIPGDFYFGGAEPSNWARMEFMIKL
jgi:hypothetical protein